MKVGEVTEIKPGMRGVIIDIGDPFGSLDALRKLTDEELADAFVQLSHIALNLNTIGKGLMHEMAERERKKEATTQASGPSEDDLARMKPVTEA